MASTGFTNPPLPTNDGGTPAQDQPTTGTYDTKATIGDIISALTAAAPQLGPLFGTIEASSGVMERHLSILTETLKWIVLHLAKVETDIAEPWAAAEASAYEAAIPALTEAATIEAAAALDVLSSALVSASGGEVTFGHTDMAEQAQRLFNEVVQPFTLVNSGFDPRQTGSGTKAQSYLLNQATQLALNEWIVEQLGNHLGMGFFKSLAPFLGIIDRSVNPSNVIRQAMESSYAVLLKAPLTRDLNHQYPIKDLGLTVLAKLFLRGAIDQATYLSKCLDSGLDNTQAQQLILETAPQLSRGDIAKLLSLNYITTQDARNLLAQQGYQSATIDAILYLDTHYRYFTIAERVGNAAVSAWKLGRITQTRLEQILQQTGFTQDEITLLEIEGEFAKQHGQKSLTYSQVKELFAANIIGESDVLTFLENEGYSQTDAINLLLLDFTKEATRAATKDRLIASLRVQAEEAKISSAVAQNKNEAALAAAKEQLASELDAEATALGRIETRPGILALLGTLP